MTNKTGKLTDQFRSMMTSLRQEIEQEVIGEWFLFEQQGRLPRIHQRIDGVLDLYFFTETKSIDEERIKKYPVTIEDIVEKGWKATPVIIFRKR